MPEETIFCPYCILGDNLCPMLERPDWFICEQCGHTLLPGDPEFRCRCQNCMALNEAA